MAAGLGLPRSRLVSWSKSGYWARHPDHAIVFNATIADAAGTRLWWGDLDLTRDEAALVELARLVQLDLHVYIEGDSRRGFVEVIDPGHAVAVVGANGQVRLGDRTPLTRDPRGRIVADSRGDRLRPAGYDDAQG
ncbi:MAG TPA: hypothetical protein VKR30_01125 [Candidatus Limnocylindrales bacterium]|nr:hypothetical protein [Candidatus Limnocylindrales bacterium]